MRVSSEGMARLSIGVTHVTVADLPDVNAFSQAPPGAGGDNGAEGREIYQVSKI
jgi:hypothetical protein